MGQVSIKISGGGKVHMEGQGFKGDACKQVMDQLAKVLTAPKVEATAEQFELPISNPVQVGG